MHYFPKITTFEYRRVKCETTTGWWFGTVFIFSVYWECHHPNWLIFFRGVETTKQIIFWVNFITTSLFSLTGIMVRIRGIIPKWPNYSGEWNIMSFTQNIGQHSQKIHVFLIVLNFQVHIPWRFKIPHLLVLLCRFAVGAWYSFPQ